MEPDTSTPSGQDPLVAAFAALRAEGFAEPERWRDIYRAGLIEAFRTRRFDEASELAVFASSALESQGRLNEALAELDFALSNGRSSVDATANLLGTRALFLALQGDDDAHGFLREAQALRPLERPYAELLLRTHEALLGLIFLEVGAAEVARGVAQDAREAGADWLSFGLDIWSIPYAVATGSLRDAQPWASVLSAHTLAARAHFRFADAESLEVALAGVSSASPPDLGFVDRMSRNHFAAWRGHTVGLRLALLRGDEFEAEAHIDVLRQIAARLHLSHREWVSAFASSMRMLRYHDDGTPGFEPPDRLILTNLSAVMAALETAAVCGRQDEVLMWRRWIEHNWRDHVVTSLEWPASIHRVRSLLDLRLGGEASGIAHMENGLRWARAAGFIIEESSAMLQLSEILGLVSRPVARSRWRALRDGGRDRLRALGIDVTRVAYAISDAVTLGRVEGGEPKLSPREVDVLALLDEGLTYREAAARLGIEWRTVQVHAKHIYAKLGVSGKMQASRRARELGIL